MQATWTRWSKTSLTIGKSLSNSLIKKSCARLRISRTVKPYYRPLSLSSYNTITVSTRSSRTIHSNISAAVMKCWAYIISWSKLKSSSLRFEESNRIRPILLSRSCPKHSFSNSNFCRRYLLSFQCIYKTLFWLILFSKFKASQSLPILTSFWLFKLFFSYSAYLERKSRLVRICLFPSLLLCCSSIRVIYLNTC